LNSACNFIYPLAYIFASHLSSRRLLVAMAAIEITLFYKVPLQEERISGILSSKSLHCRTDSLLSLSALSRQAILWKVLTSLHGKLELCKKVPLHFLCVLFHFSPPYVTIGLSTAVNSSVTLPVQVDRLHFRAVIIYIFSIYVVYFIKQCMK
jgi:hypothetical protein